MLEITFLRGRRTKQWSESSELVAGLSQPAPRAASSLCRPGLGLACPAAWDQRESKTLSLPLSSHPAAKGRAGFSSVKGFKLIQAGCDMFQEEPVKNLSMCNGRLLLSSFCELISTVTSVVQELKAVFTWGQIWVSHVRSQ